MDSSTILAALCQISASTSHALSVQSASIERIVERQTQEFV